VLDTVVVGFQSPNQSAVGVLAMTLSAVASAGSELLQGKASATSR
jgi:hypothetical protein